jgi:RNA polymerase sigma-70 factor (ECF subfamily)
MNLASVALLASFDPFVVQQAEIGASRLVAAPGFHQDDWEDLRQELLVDYLERLPQFDPSRGDARGFMFGVVRHRAAQMAMEQRRRIRTDDSPRSRTASTVEPELDLSLDVAAVVDRLPEHLRELAIALKDLTPKEAARRLGRSRTRIYQLIQQIRSAFVEAGVTPELLNRRGAAR